MTYNLCMHPLLSLRQPPRYDPVPPLPGVLQQVSIKTDLIWHMPQFRLGLAVAAVLVAVVWGARTDAYRRFHVRHGTLLPKPGTTRITSISVSGAGGAG